MAYSYNADTNEITMVTGDTADIYATIDWDRMTQDAVLMFAIFDPTEGQDVFRKVVAIEDGQAHIRLCNRDTRGLIPGSYRWNLRLVTNPEYNDDGSVRVDDCSDDVISAWNSPPKFKLKNGGGYV